MALHQQALPAPICRLGVEVITTRFFVNPDALEVITNLCALTKSVPNFRCGSSEIMCRENRQRNKQSIWTVWEQRQAERSNFSTVCMNMFRSSMRNMKMKRNSGSERSRPGSLPIMSFVPSRVFCSFTWTAYLPLLTRLCSGYLLLAYTCEI